MMQCYWPIAEPLMGSANVNTSKTNQWQRLSWCNVRSNWNDSYSAQFRFDFEGMASNTIAYIDDAMLIDLTAAFGTGNEPTQEWCDTNIEYFSGNKTIQYEVPITYDLTSTIPNRIKTGDILNCPYSGSAKSITLPKGKYRLECWGAQGGYRNSSTYGGKGGYSAGTITLTEKTLIYLYSGGAGNTGKTAGGFNGGGKRQGYNGGGGGSDIRIGTDSLYARVIVAGGGGSDGAPSKTGMYGGGTTGGSTTQNYGNGGYGGTQTGVSSSSWQTTSQSTSTTAQSGAYAGFGFGGNGIACKSGYGGAGGGGWYGGSGAYPDSSGDDDRGGGGGSGYIYTSTSASTYPSGCLLNSQHYLENATTLAGNAAFTSPIGVSETGHTGDGYIRITVIEATSGNTLIKTDSTTWKNYKNIFIKIPVETILPNGYTQLEYIKSNGTQYINTGFKPTSNTKVVINIEPLEVPSILAFFGTRDSSNPTSSLAYNAWATNTTHIRSDYFGSSILSNETNILTKGIIDKNKNILTGYGQTITNTASTGKECSYSLFLLACNDIGTAKYYLKSILYSCKIYDNGTLIRDFIPVKRISDNEYGLWDKVTKAFYPNSGTGAFTGGPTITLSGWHKIKGVWAKTAADTWSQTL